MSLAARPVFLVAAVLLHAALVIVGIALLSRQTPTPAPPAVQVDLMPPAPEAPAASEPPRPAAPLAEAASQPRPAPPEPKHRRPAKRPSREPPPATASPSKRDTPPADRRPAPPETQPAASETPVASDAPPSPPQPAAPSTPAPPPVRTDVSVPAAYAASNRKPEYPMASRRLDEQGTVVLRVLVQADGTAGAVELKSSSGHARLDQSAMSAVSTWRFHPATVDGRPVAEWYQVSIPFKLEN